MMAGLQTIEIDLDLHRAIESARLSFDEPAYRILRRMLRLDAAPEVKSLSAVPRMRAPRSSGAYTLVLGGLKIEANSLKDLLRRAILVAARSDHSVLARLAGIETARGRRIIARSPDALYPKSPHLRDFAERLDDEWWFDTNVGRNQVQASLKVLAALLALPAIPVIEKRSEKTPLTDADFGIG